jgi:hypothetical protein
MMMSMEQESPSSFPFEESENIRSIKKSIAEISTKVEKVTAKRAVLEKKGHELSLAIKGRNLDFAVFRPEGFGCDPIKFECVEISSKSVTLRALLPKDYVVSQPCLHFATHFQPEFQNANVDIVHEVFCESFGNNFHRALFSFNFFSHRRLVG